MTDKERMDAAIRGTERLLALSDADCAAVQVEVAQRMVDHGYEPTKANLLFTVGAFSDEEWAAAMKRFAATKALRTRS